MISSVTSSITPGLIPNRQPILKPQPKNLTENNIINDNKSPSNKFELTNPVINPSIEQLIDLDDSPVLPRSNSFVAVHVSPVEQETDVFINPNQAQSMVRGGGDCDGMKTMAFYVFLMAAPLFASLLAVTCDSIRLGDNFHDTFESSSGRKGIAKTILGLNVMTIVADYVGMNAYCDKENLRNSIICDMVLRLGLIITGAIIVSNDNPGGDESDLTTLVIFDLVLTIFSIFSTFASINNFKNSYYQNER